MQSFKNKDLLREYLNSELVKGLRIKFIYDHDPIQNIDLHLRNKRRMVFTENPDLSKNQLEKKLVEKNGENKDLGTKKKQMKLRKFKRSNVFKSKISHEPTDLSKSSSLSSHVTFKVKDPWDRRLKKVSCHSCIGSSEVAFKLERPQRKKTRKCDKKSVSLEEEEYFREGYQKKRDESMDEKDGRTKTVRRQHQCSLQFKQKDRFVRSNKSTLIQRVLEIVSDPKKKNNLIGPIPIRAEGINDLTTRVAQLARQAGDGEVQRRLKLCKQNESTDSSIEFDVCIQKISLEEISGRKKRKNRSIFSPMFCFAARPESVISFKKFEPQKMLFPKDKTLNWRGILEPQQILTSKVNDALNWLNIPFLDRFRFNPQCCHVKVLECGPLSAFKTHKKKNRKYVPFQQLPRKSSRVRSGAGQKPVRAQRSKVSSVSDGTYKYESILRGGRRIRLLKKRPEDCLNFSLPLPCQAFVPSQDSSASILSNRCTPLVKALSTVVSREIYSKLNQSPQKEYSCPVERDRKDIVDAPGKDKVHKNITQTQSNPREESKFVTLQDLRSSFKNFFEATLQFSFRKAFETKNIKFIDPYKLDSYIVENFKKIANYSLKKDEFTVKGSNFSKYFCRRENIFCFESFCINPCCVSCVNISIRVDDLHLTGSRHHDGFSLSKRKLKAMVFSNNIIKTTRIPKIRKSITKQQRIMTNTYTVHVHPPDLQRLKDKVLSKWDWKKSQSSQMLKGAGDKVKETAINHSTKDISAMISVTKDVLIVPSDVKTEKVLTAKNQDIMKKNLGMKKNSDMKKNPDDKKNPDGKKKNVDVTMKSPDIKKKNLHNTKDKSDIKKKNSDITKKKSDAKKRNLDITEKNPDITNKIPDITKKIPDITNKNPDITKKKKSNGPTKINNNKKKTEQTGELQDVEARRNEILRKLAKVNK